MTAGLAKRWCFGGSPGLFPNHVKRSICCQGALRTYCGSSSLAQDPIHVIVKTFMASKGVQRQDPPFPMQRILSCLIALSGCQMGVHGLQRGDLSIDVLDRAMIVFDPGRSAVAEDGPVGAGGCVDVGDFEIQGDVVCTFHHHADIIFAISRVELSPHPAPHRLGWSPGQAKGLIDDVDSPIGEQPPVIFT